MKFIIATDHRGKEIKEKVIDILKNEFEIIDCSKENFDTDDYPDFAFKACSTLINQNIDFAVLICGTGIGMSIAANKIKGIRCALINTKEDACLAKKHNNANVLAFSANKDVNKIVECINEFAISEFEGGKHERRINKISLIENGDYDEL